MSGRIVRQGIGIGDRVQVAGVAHVVVGVSGAVVRMADTAGTLREAAVAQLLSDPQFVLMDARPMPAPARRPPELAGLEALPEQAVEQASWWEPHIAEVVYGVPPDAPPGSRPRPGFDPGITSISARERAKAAELAAQGHAVTVAMVKRRRQLWEAGGLAALVDQRLAKPSSPFGRVDPRVVAAMRQAIAEATDESTKTVKFICWRAGQILQQHGDLPEAALPAMPSRSTLYRLHETLSKGRHTTGSAATRRALAGRPSGMFGQWQPQAPGEVVQIDSTPLDVFALMEDGMPGRVELTGMIDVATRSVTAAVLRPTTKSVDACVVLARTLTPEPMRPGWSEALSMSRSVLPYERLLSLDERLAQAAAKPVIVPDTIVFDHGAPYVSRNFKAACRHLGISLQPARLGTGSDKPHIERLFGAVATLFCQFVSGYTGRNTDRRGRHVEGKPLWSMHELQELLDEWLIAHWQSRPHDGLRDPQHPGRAFTPNEKYASLIEAAGYVPLALSAGDYIELLPAKGRSIGPEGISFKRRTYISDELAPLRMMPSGLRGGKFDDGEWEMHYDPYDITHVFIRGPEGWITCRWKHLDRAPMAFGDLAWDHARKNLAAADPTRTATEAEIADAVTKLLVRAHRGPDPDEPPLSKRDRRVAARTRAVTPPPEPEDNDAPDAAHAPDMAAETPDASDTGLTGEAANQDGGEVDQEDSPLAKVIPMPMFDPYDDSDNRW